MKLITIIATVFVAKRFRIRFKINEWSKLLLSSFVNGNTTSYVNDALNLHKFQIRILELFQTSSILVNKQFSFLAWWSFPDQLKLLCHIILN